MEKSISKIEMVHEGLGQGKRPRSMGDLNAVSELLHQTFHVHNGHFHSWRLGSIEIRGTRTERPTKTAFASGFRLSLVESPGTKVSGQRMLLCPSDTSSPGFIMHKTIHDKYWFFPNLIIANWSVRQIMLARSE